MGYYVTELPLRESPGEYITPGLVWQAGLELLLSDARAPLTALLDLGAAPLRVRKRRPEFAFAAARSRAGRLALYSRRGHDGPLRLRLYEDAELEAGEGRVLTLRAARHLELYAVGFVGERLIALPDPGLYGDGTASGPFVQSGEGELSEDHGLPAAAVRKSSVGFYMDAGFVRVGGADVLIWNGDGYEPRGDGWERTFPLGAEDSILWPVLFPSVARGEGGFFYLSNRRLFEARRGEAPVRHLPTIENIMKLAPGPGGAVLLYQGQNKQGDIGKLYFPDEGAYISVKQKLMGIEGRFTDWLGYSPASREFILSNYLRLYRIPEGELLAQKKTRPRAKRG